MPAGLLFSWLHVKAQLYRLQSSYCHAYVLNRWPMHLHGDYSHVHPMDGVDNSQWSFHIPDTEHRPAKFCHFLDRTGHFVEHWQRKNTQVDDRQLAHHLYPSHRHKPFPSFLGNRSPLCPLQASFPQSVSNLMVCYHQKDFYLYTWVFLCYNLTTRAYYYFFNPPPFYLDFDRLRKHNLWQHNFHLFSEKKAC